MPVVVFCIMAALVTSGVYFYGSYQYMADETEPEE